MKGKLLLSITLICSLFIGGCGLVEIERIDKTDTVNVDETSTTDVQKKLIKALGEASREDCKKLYTIFSGAALYLETAKLTKIPSSAEFHRLNVDVNSDLNYTQKYPDLTNIIKIDMESKGLNKPQPMSDVKATFISTYREYAEACMMAAKTKPTAQ